jgi:hypothetical protein
MPAHRYLDLTSTPARGAESLTASHRLVRGGARLSKLNFNFISPPWLLLSRAEQLIVFRVRANPEPHHILAVHLRERAITKADSDRVDVVPTIYFLKFSPG